jgi:hypothetical protein
VYLQDFNVPENSWGGILEVGKPLVRMIRLRLKGGEVDLRNVEVVVEREWLLPLLCPSSDSDGFWVLSVDGSVKHCF